MRPSAGGAGSAAAAPGATVVLEPLAGFQIPLGGQLRVGLDDEPPRNAEVSRQRSRGGKPLPGRQAPAADRVAQAVLELGPQRAFPGRSSTSTSGP